MPKSLSFRQVGKVPFWRKRSLFNIMKLQLRITSIQKQLTSLIHSASLALVTRETNFFNSFAHGLASKGRLKTTKIFTFWQFYGPYESALTSLGYLQQLLRVCSHEQNSRSWKHPQNLIHCSLHQALRKLVDSKADTDNTVTTSVLQRQTCNLPVTCTSHLISVQMFCVDLFMTTLDTFIFVFFVSSIKCAKDESGFTANDPHHNRFTALFPGPPGQPVLEENFWTLWCKGKLTEADTLTIRLGATPSGLTSAHLHHRPIFLQTRYRSWNSVKALKATSTFGLGRRL